MSAVWKWRWRKILKMSSISGWLSQCRGHYSKGSTASLQRFSWLSQIGVCGLDPGYLNIRDIIRGGYFSPFSDITSLYSDNGLHCFYKEKKSPPSMCVGRVTSWLNLFLERKELTSLDGLLFGHTLKSPMTRVVFSKLMNSFKKRAALNRGSSWDRYMVMISRPSREIFPSWMLGSLMLW